MIAEDLVDFAGRLRAAGLVVEHPRLAAAAEALTMIPRPPYWPLRLTLCGRHSDLPIFDAVYHGWLAATAGIEQAEAVPVVAPAAGEADQRAGAVEPTEGGGGAAYATGLAGRDLRTLSDAERAEIARLIAQLAPAARLRRAPRWVPARSGRIDAARTVRQMIRNGGEPTRLRHRRRARRPRRLLLLIDVSRSMQTYLDALLLFAHAAVAAGPRTTEVFLIGTRWTRVTTALQTREPQAAMAAIAAVQADWQQGTQLGRSLESFLSRWSGHRAVRAAVVVIGSDGLEEDGDPTRLPRQIARLSRIAHRIIWVNPARRRPGFRPAHPAFRHSLPYADEQLSGHTLDELRALAEAIAR